MIFSGRGKYDKELTELRERLGADGILLMVAGGSRGSSFEVQVTDLALLRMLPMVLRDCVCVLENELTTSRPSRSASPPLACKPCACLDNECEGAAGLAPGYECRKA